MRLLLICFSLLCFSQAAIAEPHRRLVNFEWESLEGAKGYEIEFRNVKKQDSKPYKFKVTTAAWNGRLPAGKYMLRLRAFDYRGVPGEWGEQVEFDVNLENVVPKFPTANAQIETKKNDKFEVDFEWNAVPNAENYTIEISTADGKIIKSDVVSKTEYSLKLPVSAAYSWKVSAKGKEDLASDATTVSQFTLLGGKVATPEIEKPETEFARKIRWGVPEFANAYDLTIHRWNPEAKTWEAVKTLYDHPDSLVELEETWPGGEFRLSLKAKAPLRQPSEEAVQVFRLKNGVRSPAAEYNALLRKSIDRVSGWYGIASYLITQIKYNNVYRETNTQLRYNALGGTGRLGVGRFSENSPWGFLGILDLSGFLMQGRNLTFASLETSAVWKKPVGELGELRLQMGGYYKALPGTIGDISSGTADFKTIASAGPHGGIEYWHSLSAKLGIQFNAHIYLSLFKVETPNDGGIDPTISNQIGFMGSWRFSPKFTGLMGYARREDNIKFRAGPGASTPGSNETTVTGDYLNFFAEYAF